MTEKPSSGHCSASSDCNPGWMCNFDYGSSGFCENCEHFPTESDCYQTGFITKRGTKECLDTCNLEIATLLPTQVPEGPTKEPLTAEPEPMPRNLGQTLQKWWQNIG